MDPNAGAQSGFVWVKSVVGTFCTCMGLCKGVPKVLGTLEVHLTGCICSLCKGEAISHVFVVVSSVGSLCEA